MSPAIANRRLLFASSFVAYALVFAVFMVVERPGMGTGHFYYLPIALLALASGPTIGFAGGVVATTLYVTGVVLNPYLPANDVLTVATSIRLLTYTSIGTLIGWFAARNRALVDELTILAERDAVTGLPNTRAFEAAIERRLEAGARFALLIGDLDRLVGDDGDTPDDVDVLRRLAEMLGRTLSPGDDLARVGGNEFAILAAATGRGDAARLCSRLETALAQQGLAIRFGWAMHPDEGRNALSLYRAADERLYARKLLTTAGAAVGTAETA